MTSTLTPFQLVVLVVGLGNVGSALAWLLARNERIAELVLVDDDAYENGNLPTQSILADAIGQSKVRVAATLSHAIRPALRVREVARRVEHVPLGQLRADVVISCVDSKRSRQHINEIVGRLGPGLWIDTGVRPDASLARVSRVTPCAEHACVECSWSALDYASLESRQLCNGVSDSRATGGSAALGALAASFAVLTLERWLDDGRPAVEHRQTVIDARGETAFASAIRRLPTCRFDHCRWRLEPVDERTTLRSLAAAIHDSSPAFEKPLSIRVAGRVLVAGTHCARCERSDPVLTTLERLPLLEGCPRCGATRTADPFACAEELLLDSIDALDTPLVELLETGDVISVESQTESRHFELVPSTLSASDSISVPRRGLSP